MSCANCAKWEERFDALWRETLAMKREGFVPAPVANDLPAAPDLPASVRAAIAELAPPGSLLSRQQAKIAWDLLARGDDPDQVAAIIAAGEEAPL